MVAPDTASHGFNEPNLGTTNSVKDQQDPGPGEGSVVSFRQGVKGHPESHVSVGSQEQKGISCRRRPVGL